MQKHLLDSEVSYFVDILLNSIASVKNPSEADTDEDFSTKFYRLPALMYEIVYSIESFSSHSIYALSLLLYLILALLIWRHRRPTLVS
jgi:hypothetical protein